LIENTLHTANKNVILDQAIHAVLAEDDIDDAYLFELAINELNIKVNLDHVKDGEKLLAFLKQFIPDIIFLDIEIPCKDGISCITEIRKNKDFDNVPVIIISGHTNGKYIENAYSTGANYYLIKGNSIIQLVERLKKIFSLDWKRTLYFPPKDEFVLNHTKGVA
jgi:DNA-binding response OmpR family regulator